MAKREEAAAKAVDLFFFVHRIPFHIIGSRLFHQMIRKVKECPIYTPCHRVTLSTTRLAARSNEADVFWEKHLQSSLGTALMYCTDGWKNLRRHSYHNHILVSATGPCFLGLEDVTGKGGRAVDVHQEVMEVLGKLEPELRSRVIIGCTDTPAVNKLAWKLLRESLPHMLWMGCMAHEINLLFREWSRKVRIIQQLHSQCKLITIWVRNHGGILQLFRSKVQLKWKDKRKHNIVPYMPGDTRMVTSRDSRLLVMHFIWLQPSRGQNV